jgi:myosin heavy subunit
MNQVVEEVAEMFSGEVYFTHLDSHEEYGEAIIVKTKHKNPKLLSDSEYFWNRQARFKQGPTTATVAASLESIGHEPQKSLEEVRSSTGKEKKLKQENKKLRRENQQLGNQVSDLKSDMQEMKQMMEQMRNEQRTNRNTSSGEDSTDDKFDDLFEEAGLNEPEL